MIDLATWADQDGPPPVEGERRKRSDKVNKFARPSSLAFAGSKRSDRPSADGRASSPGEVLHCRFQDSASWLTPAGVAKKRRILEGKGLPDMKGRRFITLSFDQKMFPDCPLSAYLAGREHMRRFLEAGRVAGLWERDAWWAWKLEFQRNGWPHWHLIIDRTRKFSRDEMDKIKKIWGYGRTNCRRISKSRFGYQFKYAFKGVFQEDADEDTAGLCVPLWFLEYESTRRVVVKWKGPNGEKLSCEAEKPDTFGRARFWQASRNFYTGIKPVSRKPKDPVSGAVPRKVEQVVTDQQQAVMVIARSRSGKYLISKRMRLGVSFKQFIRVHLWGAENGAGCTLSARSFILDPYSIRQTIDNTQIWEVHQLEQINKLTLRKALQLRQNRESLERC